MSRRLVLVNVLLVAVSLASVGYIARELAPKASGSAGRARTVPTVSTSPTAAQPEESPPSGGYATVASRNLFSPTRTDAPSVPGATAGGAPPAGPKPNLYGVVLREGASVAYLEDPATKRVGGYRAGDTVAGGTVRLIAADHVVLDRPEGRVQVLLSDPAKPRPPAPAPVAAGQAAPQPGTLPPGTVPRGPEATAQGQGAPQQPPAVGQPGPQFPGRRPLPPNLRRVPPGSTADAPQQ
jgi:hypothetical protein